MLDAIVFFFSRLTTVFCDKETIILLFKSNKYYKLTVILVKYDSIKIISPEFKHKLYKQLKKNVWKTLDI